MTSDRSVSLGTPKPHVLLWSQTQSALHVEPVEDMLSSNRKAYAENRRMDYVPILFGTNEQCHDAARAVRHTIAARQATCELND